MSLWTTLLPLHQALSSVSHNHALSYLGKENIELIDSFTGDEAATETVQKRIEGLRTWVDRCLADIDNVNNFVALKEKFSELLMFTKLARRYPTQAIPETTTPTPDFYVKFRTLDLFVEMKSLNLLNTEANLRSIMNDALESKIETEHQVKQGRRVAMSHFVIQPYRRSDNYNPDSTTAVVEALIEKVDQNIGRDQFGFGSTILLLDFSNQLLLHGSPRDNLKREFVCNAENVAVPQSGELWHLGFGAVGMPMKRVIDFEGLDENDAPLSREGILRKHDFIAGLAIHHEGKFWGAALRSRQNINAVEFLQELCEEVAIETPETIS
jgi:hypothetical protein